jgi:hypothetical protein
MEKINRVVIGIDKTTVADLLSPKKFSLGIINKISSDSEMNAPVISKRNM